jgi:hypothetical protein
VNDASFDKLESHTVPDVVLVKKYYDRSERKRRRIWKLKHLAEEDTLSLSNYYLFGKSKNLLFSQLTFAVITVLFT